MSSIKLTADSGGGTFELKAPSSGSNARVLTLPDSASGTVLTTTNPKAGNIIQVVFGSTTTEVESTTSSFVDTGVTATITPSSTSSKIMVISSIQYFIKRDATETNGTFRLLRDSTAISTHDNCVHKLKLL